MLVRPVTYATMLALMLLAGASPLTAAEPVAGGDTLPDTERLNLEGDIASHLVDGVDKFLLGELEKSLEARARHWKRDTSVEPNRARLAHILGLRDPRVAFDGIELLATTSQPALIAQADRFDVFVVRWPAFGDVHGEGLLLVPHRIGGPPSKNAIPTGAARAPKFLADVIAIPDADQTPEQICGLADGIPIESQFARRLADNGCRVLVPVLISREMQTRSPPGRQGGNQFTNREFLYRSAFELGRHLIGYEVQKVLAAVDWIEKDHAARNPNAATGEARIGVFGYGEGGMLALYAAALDTRIDACGVSGFFGSRQRIWNEPIDRNVFGLLDQFGDAELATLVAPRPLVIENRSYPQVSLPGKGGAPAELAAPADVLAEVQRAEQITGVGPGKSTNTYVDAGPEQTEPVFGGVPALSEFLHGLGIRPETFIDDRPTKAIAAIPDAAARQARQIHEIDRHSQWVLRESPYVRQEFVKNLDTSSVSAYEKTVEPYREVFRNDVIGRFDYEPLPANPRTRKAYDTEKWTGYEVVLDVFPDVIAYGVLLLPKDLEEGERRPVVVCQHGLEGRPANVIEGDVAAYHDYAAKLAERGFITFAPQNLYIFQDRFRTLQRKANPLGKTLFSIIVPQHQQIVDWLQTLPYVDPDRIGFYGLSYGGKTAMRIPSLVTDYALSICSADFNEWVDKNASTRGPYSYVWTPEYEIFEFDLGSTFNYAEMAALICPRPFMVERGHFDLVGTDEQVAHEFAKVRNLYQARLGIGDRTEIEWFVGPHTINGVGTYDFLHRHLNWPKR